jgi:hypothetical protein
MRRYPPEQLLAFGVLGLIFLPLVLPCLLVSLPFAGLRQGGR